MGHADWFSCFRQPTLAAAHEWFNRIRQVAQMCIIIDPSIAAAITKNSITRDPSLPIINLHYKTSISYKAKRFSLITRNNIDNSPKAFVADFAP